MGAEPPQVSAGDLWRSDDGAVSLFGLWRETGPDVSKANGS